MLVSTSNGDFQFQSVQEVISFLSDFEDKTEELWISNVEEYPCLAIAIKNGYAAVNYFEGENGDMFLSFNDSNDKEVTFIAGGEEWTPDANAVISFDMAISCIKEFLITYKKPQCIQWQEL